MKKTTSLWTLGVGSMVLALGIAGYAGWRGLAMGALLGVGGSDASGEAWRMAQSDPRLLREYEEAVRSRNDLAREEDRLMKLLFGLAGGFALTGLGTAAAAWRARSPRSGSRPGPGLAR